LRSSKRRPTFVHPRTKHCRYGTESKLEHHFGPKFSRSRDEINSFEKSLITSPTRSYHTPTYHQEATYQFRYPGATMASTSLELAGLDAAITIYVSFLVWPGHWANLGNGKGTAKHACKNLCLLVQGLARNCYIQLLCGHVHDHLATSMHPLLNSDSVV
jgi:hypothetical protein